MHLRKPHPNARALRADMPSAEKRLWRFIRRKQLGGFRFRRQHTIGPYVADFACVEARLVIELDGDQHGIGAGPARDAKRDAFIEREGWTILRFWNREVYDNIDGVLDVILDTSENARRTAKVVSSSADGKPE